MAEYEIIGKDLVEVSKKISDARDQERTVNKSKRLIEKNNRKNLAPKRSELNNLKNKAENDKTDNDSRATIKSLVDMVEKLIAFIGVAVNEDV